MDRTYEYRDAVPAIIATVIMLPIMAAIAITIDEIYFKLSFGLLAVMCGMGLYSGIDGIIIFDSEGFRHLLHKEVCKWESVTDAVMCVEYRRRHARVHGRRRIEYLAIYTDKYRYHPKKRGVPKKEKALTMYGVFSIDTFERYLQGYRRDMAVRYPQEGGFYET